MRLAFLLALTLSPCMARAHYHMLLPNKVSVKTGEEVTFVYQFGHPFESQMFACERPARAVIYAPDGVATDVRSMLQKIQVGPKESKVTAYQLKFTPPGRGDFTVVFKSPEIWMEDEKHFIHDVTRVVIHVQAQKGWDRQHVPQDEFAIVPMTRPYGVRPQSVFQVNAIGASDISHLVEIERYNPSSPAELPPEEFVTQSIRTDRNGVATFTLHDPGWWGIAAIRFYRGTQIPRKERDRKMYPVVERAIMWVFVDDYPPRKTGQ